MVITVGNAKERLKDSASSWEKAKKLLYLLAGRITAMDTFLDMGV